MDGKERQRVWNERVAKEAAARKDAQAFERAARKADKQAVTRLIAAFKYGDIPPGLAAAVLSLSEQRGESVFELAHKLMSAYMRDFVAEQPPVSRLL